MDRRGQEQQALYRELEAGIEEVSRRRVFFVGGAMKSGTTWVQLLLDAHPQVCCRGEGHITGVLAPLLQKAVGEYNRVITGKNRDIFGEIGGFPLLEETHLRWLLRGAAGLLLSRAASGSGAEVVGEKTPDNIRGMALLLSLFPQARFIHVLRDLTDVAVSAWFHNLRVSPEWTEEKFSSIDAYALANLELWTNELRLARRFSGQHPGLLLTVRYEEMLEDAEPSLRRMLRFLALEASDEIVAACLAAASFEALSHGRSPGEEDLRSHFRKGIAGEGRRLLKPSTLERFESLAGPELRAFDRLRT